MSHCFESTQDIDSHKIVVISGTDSSSISGIAFNAGFKELRMSKGDTFLGTAICYWMMKVDRSDCQIE
jgi:hypothetical protein